MKMTCSKDKKTCTCVRARNACVRVRENNVLKTSGLKLRGLCTRTENARGLEQSEIWH